MTAGLKVIEKTSSIKKKVKLGKNKKKAWRKTTELVDVRAVQQQEEEDQASAGFLGDDNADIFFDTNEEVTQESHSAGAVESQELNYTVDPATGLKATSRPKTNKVLKAHKLLTGLPGGSAGPYKGRSRKLKVSTLAEKLELKERSANNLRNVKKNEIKQAKAWRSMKISKKNISNGRKLSFDKNLWMEAPEATFDSGFTDGPMRHARLCMKQEPINNRKSKRQHSRIPGVLTPDAGLSYNPDLESHQKLLKKAVLREVRRTAAATYRNALKNSEFPVGADPVSTAELIQDMQIDGTEEQPEGKKARNKLAKKQQVLQEAEDVAEEVVVAPKDRKTHQQRLRELRYQKQLREDQALKQQRKRENMVNRIPEFTREMEDKSEELKERHQRRLINAVQRSNAPPKHFTEGDVEVALGDQLRGSLLKVQPTSNPVTETLTHMYRRGILHNHAKRRNHEKKGVFGSLQKRKKPRVESVTEADLKIKRPASKQKK